MICRWIYEETCILGMHLGFLDPRRNQVAPFSYVDQYSPYGFWNVSGLDGTGAAWSILDDGHVVTVHSLAMTILEDVILHV